MCKNKTSFKCGPDGPKKDWQRERLASKVRKDFGLGQYDGRYADRSEEILRALPATAMQLYKQGVCGGLSHVSLWVRIQELHAYGWVHVQAYEKHPNNGQYQTIYAAGPGVNAKRPTDDDVFRDPLPEAVIRPDRKANPFDALLGYGT